VAHVEGDGYGVALAIGIYRDGTLKMVRHDAIYFDGAPRFAADGSLVGACGGNSICEIAAADVAKAAEGVLPVPRKLELPVKPMGRLNALKDESGCLWFRSNNQAAFRCPGDRAFQFLPLDIAEVTQFNFLTLGPDNQLWFLSDSAILSYGRPGKWRTIGPANGMPRMVECVYHGKDGSIWMSSVGSLWRMIPPERLELWSERNGIALQGLVLKRGGSGEVLIGGSSGLLKLSADRTRWEPFGDQKEMRYVRDIYPTPIGTTLISSTFSGVMELDRNGAIVRRTTPAVARFEFEDPTHVWTSGLRTQLLQFGPEGLRFEDGPRTFPARSATDFARDTHGRLWHCTQQGLSRLDPGSDQWKSWSTKDGLLDSACRAIAISASGSEVWLMYQIDAMSKLDFSRPGPPVITNLHGETAGRHFAYIIRRDRQDRLWHGGEGIHVARMGQTGPGDWITLSESSGFPSTQNEVDRYLFADTEDDSVWIISPQHVHHYWPPKDLFTKRPVPRVFLSGAPSEELEKGQRASFDFGSLYAERRNQLRFRYRLGPDHPWVETADTTVSHDNLAAGSYSFELSARVLPSGDWTTPPASYPFRVIAPFWQTPAALGTAAALALCGLTAVVWIKGRELAAYRRQKQNFLRALEGKGDATDSNVQRLLELTSIPTHLPDLSPWRDDATTEREWPDPIGDRFQAESVVASGGFATVYLARDLTRDGARTAVKIFHLKEAERAWMMKRFAQEIESLKRMDHPNVVRFLEAGETSRGEPFLAMDFVEGQTLRNRLRGGPLARETTAELILQIGAALDAIHRVNVIHRDIKPENLMLTPEGRIVVIDFSIAIARDPRATQHALSVAAGSFFYMAPEQVYGFAAHATDIYSFALVVFEMLTGKRAGDLGLGSTSGSLSEETVEALAKLCPDLPRAELLGEALRDQVKRRPQEALHFARCLADWLRS